jgi:hypothetical protein
LIGMTRVRRPEALSHVVLPHRRQRSQARKKIMAIRAAMSK